MAELYKDILRDSMLSKGCCMEKTCFSNYFIHPLAFFSKTAILEENIYSPKRKRLCHAGRSGLQPLLFFTESVFYLRAVCGRDRHSALLRRAAMGAGIAGIFYPFTGFFPEREGSKLARKLIQPSQTTYFFSTPATTSAIIPIRALHWSIPGSDSRAATRKCCWLRPNFHT